MTEPTVFPAHEAELARYPGAIVIGSFRTMKEAEQAKGKKPGKDYLLTTIPFKDLSRLYLWAPCKHYGRRLPEYHENRIAVRDGRAYWLDCGTSVEEQVTHIEEAAKKHPKRAAA